MLRFALSVLISIVLIGQYGCSRSANIRSFRTSDAEAQAILSGSTGNKRAKYIQLTSTNLNGENKMGEIGIELPDGRRMAIGDLTESILKANVPPGILERTTYFFGAISIITDHGRIIGFDTGYNPDIKDRSPPVLLGRNLKRRYVFPLSQEELIELIGNAGQQRDFIGQK